MPSSDTSDSETAAEVLVISRELDAPRHLVYAAWTEPERLAQWWGPKGFEMVRCTLDLRPGGTFHYGMRAGNSHTMWGKWVFRDVEAPERLVFVSSFSDEAGNVTRAPFSADWPLLVLSTVTFEEHDGRTRLTLRGEPIEASDAEHAAFAAGITGMNAGWAGTLGQLETYLAEATQQVTR